MDITSTRMWQESVAIARELLNITDSDDGSSSGTDDSDGMRGKPAEKKVHACVVCDKTFTRAWVLKNHMRLHNEEKPHKCPEPNCNCVFADRSNLRAHQRVRGHNNWVHKCKNCGKTFPEEAYLKRHLPTACRKYAVYMKRKNMQPKRAPRKSASEFRKEEKPQEEIAADMQIEMEKNDLTTQEMPLKNKEFTKGSSTDTIDDGENDKQTAPLSEVEAANAMEDIKISDSVKEPGYVNIAVDDMETEKEQKRKKEFLAELGLMPKPKIDESAVKPEVKSPQPELVVRLPRLRMGSFMQPTQNEREDSAKNVAPKREQDIPEESVRKSKRIREQLLN